MTPSQFRSTLPEFSSVSDYPDSQVSFWITVASGMLIADRWQDLLDLGTALFVAHHMVIGQRDQLAASGTGVPGEANGPVVSKSVDKVSVTFDPGAAAYEGAGFWNQTVYGIRLMQMMRMVGAGGVQM